MKKNDTIYDKSLANSIRKGEISKSNLNKDKRKKIDKILKKYSKDELEKSSKKKYKFSKRKIVHRKKSKNESIELDFKVITDINKWNNNKKINNMKMKKETIKRFDTFINESNSQEPVRYPVENKFKRIIEFSDETEQSLNDHHFNKDGGDEGNFIIFDIMSKNYEIVQDESDDIRPCFDGEFDHIMNNL
jgi:hypothetical protein